MLYYIIVCHIIAYVSYHSIDAVMCSLADALLADRDHEGADAVAELQDLMIIIIIIVTIITTILILVISIISIIHISIYIYIYTQDLGQLRAALEAPHRLRRGAHERRAPRAGRVGALASTDEVGIPDPN